MQCPKCHYEPTMTEMQASPDKCSSCGVYYSKFDDEATRTRADKPKANGSRKLVAFLAIIFLLAVVGGMFGWTKYQAHNAAMKEVETQVRLASAYVDQMISTADGAKAITFREMFENADRYVAEIDAALVKVSVVEPRIAEIDPAQRYMRGAQEMIRNISGQARAVLDFSNAKDKDKRAEEQASSSNSYIRDQARETRLEALDEQIEALDSMKARREAVKKVAEELAEVEKELTAFGRSAFVRPESIAKTLQSE